MRLQCFCACDTLAYKKGGDNMAQKRKGSNTGIPGLSFSLSRATGVTAAKRKIAKATGIPTSKAGRQRKLGKMLGMK